MSVFRCNICDEQIDSDFHGCHEDPKDKCELICTNCFDKLEDEHDKEIECHVKKFLDTHKFI